MTWHGPLLRLQLASNLAVLSSSTKGEDSHTPPVLPAELAMWRVGQSGLLLAF